MEEGDWSYSSGSSAVEKLVARGKSFSGLFAQNDQMAIGAIHARRQAGRRVPEDVAVVGYDDRTVAAFRDPSLTTIRQPMCQVGQVATRLLIQAIEDSNSVQDGAMLKTTCVRQRSCP